MGRLALMLLSCSSLAATTLTGTINTPGGTGVNGSIYFSLNQQGSQATTCGPALQVVPTYRVKYTLTNGQLPGGSFIYGNDCLLPGGTYYNVQIIDNNGNKLTDDRWVITGSTCDVGTIVAVSISGSTSVMGAPGVIVTTPLGVQTITQPSGTYFNINNLDVTGTFNIGPSGSLAQCTPGSGCAYSQGVAFHGGLTTDPASNSTIYVGNGSMYVKAYSGYDPACGTAGNSGFIGVRTDDNKLQVCSGTTLLNFAAAATQSTPGRGTGTGTAPTTPPPSSGFVQSIPFELYNGGKTVANGVQNPGGTIVPQPCTITGWTWSAKESGSRITMDIWRANNAVPTGVAQSIIGGGSKPASKSLITNGSVSNWASTKLAASDVLILSVSAANGITKGTLNLQCQQ